jgi:hypothetical protein
MHGTLREIEKRKPSAGEAWIEAYFKTPEGKATARRFLEREARQAAIPAGPTYPAGGMFGTSNMRWHNGTYWGRP